jgi:hypothetical protein
LNIKKYGQRKTPEIKVSQVNKVPIAMFVGEYDDLATPKDTRWAKFEMKTTVYYEVWNNMDHGSFHLGKDMTYLNTALNLANTYGKNPVKTDQDLFQHLMLY